MPSFESGFKPWPNPEIVLGIHPTPAQNPNNVHPDCPGGQTTYFRPNWENGASVAVCRYGVFEIPEKPGTIYIVGLSGNVDLEVEYSAFPYYRRIKVLKTTDAGDTWTDITGATWLDAPAPFVNYPMPQAPIGGGMSTAQIGATIHILAQAFQVPSPPAPFSFRNDMTIHLRFDMLTETWADHGILGPQISGDNVGDNQKVNHYGLQPLSNGYLVTYVVGADSTHAGLLWQMIYRYEWNGATWSVGERVDGQLNERVDHRVPQFIVTPGDIEHLFYIGLNFAPFLDTSVPTVAEIRHISRQGGVWGTTQIIATDGAFVAGRFNPRQPGLPYYYEKEGIVKIGIPYVSTDTRVPNSELLWDAAFYGVNIYSGGSVHLITGVEASSPVWANEKITGSLFDCNGEIGNDGFGGVGWNTGFIMGLSMSFYYDSARSLLTALWAHPYAVGRCSGSSPDRVSYTDLRMATRNEAGGPWSAATILQDPGVNGTTPTLNCATGLGGFLMLGGYATHMADGTVSLLTQGGIPDVCSNEFFNWFYPNFQPFPSYQAYIGDDLFA